MFWPFYFNNVIMKISEKYLGEKSFYWFKSKTEYFMRIRLRKNSLSNLKSV